ncbi:hypothetical protein A7M48_19405 [Acinetobacter baumannii]|nr:hypothetical protein A7M48_19405 [Acinetobacter baumannii]
MLKALWFLTRCPYFEKVIATTISGCLNLYQLPINGYGNRFKSLGGHSMEIEIVGHKFHTSVIRTLHVAGIDNMERMHLEKNRSIWLSNIVIKPFFQINLRQIIIIHFN